MKQRPLMPPPPARVCPDCFVNMRPEVKGSFPVWRCPKCHQEYHREEK